MVFNNLLACQRGFSWRGGKAVQQSQQSLLVSEGLRFSFRNGSEFASQRFWFDRVDQQA